MIKKSTIKDISKETQLQSDAVANERTVPSEVVMTKVYKRTDAKGCLPIRIADGHKSVRTMAMCGMSPYFNNSPISAILHETKRSQKTRQIRLRRGHLGDIPKACGAPFGSLMPQSMNDIIASSIITRIRIWDVSSRKFPMSRRARTRTSPEFPQKSNHMGDIFR